MGSLFSCDRCDLTSSTSVFTFSEDLVSKIVDGKIPEPQVEEKGKAKDLNDRQWMEKLHCIDNVHTNLYGLNQAGFDALMARVEKRLSEYASLKYDVSELIECYVKNPECTLRCAYFVKEYIDQIDLERLKKIKLKVDAESLQNQK